MSDAEIGACAPSWPAGCVPTTTGSGARTWMPALSSTGSRADVTVEPVTANGVRAEWTSTPSDARDAALL